MVSSLKRFLSHFFDHYQEENEYGSGTKSSRRDAELKDALYIDQSTHISIQKQKQLFYKTHVSDTHIKQYLKNLIEYDTSEYENISNHLKIQPILETKRATAASQKCEPNFHCVYCHLIKVLLYHPVKYKSASSKKVNAINEYCKDYEYLSNKLGKALSYILANANETNSDNELVKNGYGLNSTSILWNMASTEGLSTCIESPESLAIQKKISLGNLNYLINNLEVNTADLYANKHEFNNITGEDLTLQKIEKKNEREMKLFMDSEGLLSLSSNDKINAMLNWVIEDCLSLFMFTDEETEPNASKDHKPEFNYDCTEAIEKLKESGENNSTMSFGKQVWLERRKKQYEHYAIEEESKIKSCLEDNGIRAVSYLKIYELMVTGIPIRKHMNLRDFMGVCLVGWIHDGKWEDGIRA